MQGVQAEHFRAAQDVWPQGELPSPEFVALVAQDYEDLGAALWMALGENERALEAFEFYGEREFGDRVAIWAPLFEPLLDEPLFREILRESNLEGRRPRRAAP
jgi:hypothetical protein